MKWNKRFLELAKLVSLWSKDTTKVGAVMVDPTTKQVVGLGYNGFPRGVDDSSERIMDRDTKLKLVVHAEINAILNANRSVRGFDLYVYPTIMKPNVCPDCAKAVAQSGIKRVFFYKPNRDLSNRWQELAKFTEIIFNESKIEIIEVEQ